MSLAWATVSVPPDSGPGGDGVADVGIATHAAMSDASASGTRRCPDTGGQSIIAPVGQVSAWGD